MRREETAAKDSGSILGSSVETDRKVLESQRSDPAFRGDVTFAPDAPGPEAGDYRLAEAMCPSRAILAAEARPSVDKGKCILCGICQQVAPAAFRIESRFATPTKSRGGLVIAEVSAVQAGGPGQSPEEIGGRLSEKIKGVLGRSLAIREVDAGSCNGCEVEISALNNPVYDIERFGVQFVASPRHADVLLVTGVASRNLEEALRRTYDATPDPKIVVAVGACACSGGIFGDTYASGGGVGKVVPVDIFVPGCPPRPEAILYGLLLAVDRVKGRKP
jgi:Ni,Fe-hydrogenase III small subunit/ferredoxin